MRRTISIMLAAVLFVTFCGITAEAAFDEGSYNGYAYEANLNITSSTVSGNMAYQGATKLRIEGTGYYINGQGIQETMSLLSNRASSYVSFSENPENGGQFTMANCNFKVGATTIVNLTAYP